MPHASTLLTRARQWLPNALLKISRLYECGELELLVSERLINLSSDNFVK